MVHWTFRVVSATAVIACSLVMSFTPSQASYLPSGEGVTHLVDESFTQLAPLQSLKRLVATGSSALLPCNAGATGGPAKCSDSSGAVNDGDGGQLILADVSTDTPNASGLLATTAFPATAAFYAQFETQSYGYGGGARTLWLINGASANPSIPSADGSGAYGAAIGGIPGAVLGITFDAAGDAASTNGAACPNTGWSSGQSVANQVVVRAGDTSAGAGTSGYCFVTSTRQPFDSLSTHTGRLGRLHQSKAANGWQRVFVSVLPPSFTSDRAELTVAIDTVDGRGLVTVLDVALPTWAWPTDGTGIPSSLRFGLSAMNPTSGTESDVVALRNLHAVVVAPVATVPTAPRNVGVQWSDPSNGQVSATVTWRAPQSDGYSPITDYTAAIDGLTCSPTSLTGPIYTCTISSIPTGDSYAVAVTATNQVGDSDPGVTVSRINAQDQTISFTVSSPVVYGSAPVRLTPIASSGLPVNLTATGSCALVDGLLTFSQVGSCTLTATQVGTLTIAAATPVVQTIQVVPATATIKVKPVSATVDGSGHPVEATATPTALPLVISYCPVARPTQCSTTAPSQVGSYRATVKSASTNYAPAPVVTSVDILPSVINLPPEAGGPQNGSIDGGAATWQAPTDSSAQPTVQTSGGGFSPGGSVIISVTGQESLGTFTIPAEANASTFSTLLSPSSNATTVISATSVTATSASDLSSDSSIAFPFGGFPGAGSFIMVSMSSSGFVPGSTVVTELHSTPLVLSSAVADAKGVVTLKVPVPAAFAGQSHKIVIAGTYLASTTKAGSDGKVSASTSLSPDLLARLDSGAQLVITMVDQNNPSNFTKSYVSVGSLSPSTTTTTLAGSANDVLQAPPLVPTDHPAETMKQVTNLVAVVATVAATASVAASVAGSVSSIRVPSGGSPVRSAGGSSSGSSSKSSSGPLSTQLVAAAFDEADLEEEEWGDHSKLWRSPGRAKADWASVDGPMVVAPVSPLVASAMTDGSYLRAMFGSLSALLPILGIIFAILNVVQTHGYPVPGHYGTFAVVMALGALDGWSGLASTLVILVGAIVTGHLFTLNMAVAFALMAALLFGTAIIVKGMRPLVRDELGTFQDRWKRAGDLVVGPLFGGFLAKSLVGATASAAGLALPITEHALFLGVIVGFALFTRYALSTVAVLHFPKRLMAVTAHHVPKQATWAEIASLTFRQLFTALLLHAFLGWSWVLLVLIALQMVASFVGRKVSGQIPAVLYRLIPRGLVAVLVLSAVGAVGSHYMSHLTTSGFWQIAGLLILLGVYNVIYSLVVPLQGEAFPVIWLTRLAGVVAVVLTALQLTGRLF